MGKQIDIHIKNGTAIDGDQHLGSSVDIGVKDGRIVEVEPEIESKAEKVVNAKGLVVTPGFIDMHSHSDYIMPLVSSADSFVRQGITTTVVGMCGSGLAPINPARREAFLDQLVKFMPPLKDVAISWNTFGEYLDEMERTQFAINTAFFVGYESIRVAGGSGFENRQPSRDEISTMKDLLSEAMEAGAYGMSTGLIYAPQVYASTTELAEISKILGLFNGLYFSHIRGEGESVFDAIEEVKIIVKESGCRGGHIAHHKIADQKLWGQSTKSLQLIHEINEGGTSLTYDSYPYDRGCSSLITALPTWAREGGIERAVERLKDESMRERIVREVIEDINTDPTAIWENWIKKDGFENIFISSVESERWKYTLSLSITEIARREQNYDEWDVFFNILIDDEGATMITMKSMVEEDVRRVMTSQYHMFGTDGIATPPDYRFGIDHPRSFGTYPRILGRYVREEGVISLTDAIRKMTSYPADRLGLQDRGRIKEGSWADIVIFNPNTIMDTATYERPNEFPIGIECVIVNGEIVVEGDIQHPVFPGKVLRHKGANS
ncbi:MAG: D-aminoacylase [Candidatus Thorarchaeota archaeon]